MDGYSAGEVVWLLSLTREEALAHDSAPRTSTAHMSTDGTERAQSSEGPSLPAVVRWNDVHDARARVLDRKRMVQVIRLRGFGYTQQEIAEKLGVSQPTVSRAFKAAVREVLEELGGEQLPAMAASSRLSMCMRCGQRPRARHPEVRRRVRGAPPKLVRPERQASLCDHCLDEVVEARP